MPTYLVRNYTTNDKDQSMAFAIITIPAVMKELVNKRRDMFIELAGKDGNLEEIQFADETPDFYNHEQINKLLGRDPIELLKFKDAVEIDPGTDIVSGEAKMVKTSFCLLCLMHSGFHWKAVSEYTETVFSTPVFNYVRYP